MERKRPEKQRKKAGPAGKRSGAYGTAGSSICVNAACKMRKAGCSGFEACPGYKGRG